MSSLSILCHSRLSKLIELLTLSEMDMSSFNIAFMLVFEDHISISTLGVEDG